MYRSTLALVVWWVWVVFAAANVLDLAIQGHNHFSGVVIAVLVLITGVSFAAAFRPRVTADDDGMTITNPLRDHRVPWGCVERLEVGDSLEVYCRWEDGGTQRKKLYGWALHSTRRSRFKAEMRAKRKVKTSEKHSPSFAKLPPEVRAAMGKSDAELIVDSLRARGDKARGDKARGDKARGDNAKAAGAADGRPVSRWDSVAVAALVVPLLAVVILVLS